MAHRVLRSLWERLRAENRSGLTSCVRLCRAWQTPTTLRCKPWRMQAAENMDHSTRILVVDDDPELRKLIGDFLAGHGYQVEVAADVAAMRAVLAREQPDLVILDVMMPGEDGLSAARRLV